MHPCHSPGGAQAAPLAARAGHASPAARGAVAAAAGAALVPRQDLHALPGLRGGAQGASIDVGSGLAAFEAQLPPAAAAPAVDRLLTACRGSSLAMASTAGDGPGDLHKLQVAEQASCRALLLPGRSRVIWSRPAAPCTCCCPASAHRRSPLALSVAALLQRLLAALRAATEVVERLGRGAPQSKGDLEALCSSFLSDVQASGAGLLQELLLLACMSCSARCVLADSVLGLTCAVRSPLRARCSAARVAARRLPCAAAAEDAAVTPCTAPRCRAAGVAGRAAVAGGQARQPAAAAEQRLPAAAAAAGGAAASGRSRGAAGGGGGARRSGSGGGGAAAVALAGPLRCLWCI